MRKQTKHYIYFSIFILFVFGCFWVLFNYSLAGSDTSFIFQIVVASLTTILLVAVTFIINALREESQRREENRIKIFEKKIQFYNETLDKIESIYLSGGLDDSSNQDLIFVLAKAMLIASKDATDSLVKLCSSMQEKGSNSEVNEHLNNFIKEARKDLDLVDSISHGTADNFDQILVRLREIFKKETNKLRFRSDDQKRDIIKEYNNLKKDKIKWLKARRLYPSQIADWKSKLGD